MVKIMLDARHDVGAVTRLVVQCGDHVGHLARLEVDALGHQRGRPDIHHRSDARSRFERQSGFVAEDLLRPLRNFQLYDATRFGPTGQSPAVCKIPLANRIPHLRGRRHVTRHHADSATAAEGCTAARELDAFFEEEVPQGAITSGLVPQSALFHDRVSSAHSMRSALMMPSS